MSSADVPTLSAPLAIPSSPPPPPEEFARRTEPAPPYISHTKKDCPVEKSHPHLAFSRQQWPVLLGHLTTPATREDALGSCLRLFTLESNVSCALVDAPGVVGVLCGYVLGESYEYVGTRVPALQCLGRVLRHGGYRCGPLVEAMAPAIAAAACTPHAPLRAAAYAAIAAAAQGSPTEGAGAAVGAGFADSLVLRLLSEIPEHGRGRGGEEACLGALVALREVLCSSGGRTAGALPKAMSSGLVGALLEAASLGEGEGGPEGGSTTTDGTTSAAVASEELLEAALACLGVCAGDAGPKGARAALLEPSSAARLFPLLFRALGVRGSGRQGGGGEGHWPYPPGQQPPWPAWGWWMRASGMPCGRRGGWQRGWWVTPSLAPFQRGLGWMPWHRS